MKVASKCVPPPLMVFLEPSIFIGIQSYYNQTLNYNNRNRVYNYQSEKNSGVMYTECDNAAAPCCTECNKESASCYTEYTDSQSGRFVPN